eukprot:scaffold324029_cov71-Tisochrysis_lutea.AAC.1
MPGTRSTDGSLALEAAGRNQQLVINRERLLWLDNALNSTGRPQTTPPITQAMIQDYNIPQLRLIAKAYLSDVREQGASSSRGTLVTSSNYTTGG